MPTFGTMVRQKDAGAAKPVAVQAAAAAAAVATTSTGSVKTFVPPERDSGGADVGDRKAGDDISLTEEAVDPASVGPLLRLHAAGKVPPEAHEAVAKGAHSLLLMLSEAYADADFQAEIARFHKEAGGNADRYLAYLGAAAGLVQKPVFEHFGLPGNARGVIIMKSAVKKLAEDRPELKKLAGDMREQLLLPREEPESVDITTMLKEQQERVAKERNELLEKITKAPRHLLTPFAQALGLPDAASPQQIADASLRIQEKSEQLAKQRMALGRDAVIGKGKLLTPEHASLSDEELLEAVVKSFAGYLQKMLTRIVTPIETFTEDPEKFRCDWADRLVKVRHARALWGTPEPCKPSDRNDWEKLGIGLTVMDDTVDVGLLGRVRDILDGMDAEGKVSASCDPCNQGARSIWLHFETEEERAQLHPDLLDVCLRLAGLPYALMARAQAAPGGTMGDWPRLRLHPHIMAANYRRGSEYHCHKDSYNGQDNQRMLSTLLYLNPEWRPGDDGQLRVFADRGADGKSEPDERRYVDIDPLAGRLVLFRARDVWHAVREPRSPGLRWALTLWVMAE